MEDNNTTILETDSIKLVLNSDKFLMAIYEFCIDNKVEVELTRKD